MVTNDLLMKPVIRAVEKRMLKTTNRDISEGEVDHWFVTEQAKMYYRIDALGSAFLAQLKSLAWING
jgi:hypothetical protein